MNQPNRSEGILLTATPIDQHHAWLIARTRAAGHDHCRKPSEVIGQPSDMALAENYGALGEIVILNSLFRQDMTPENYVLVADRAPVGPDFTLNGIRYQIKSVPPGKIYLCINEQQRLDPRHASDFLLPVVFATPRVVRVLRPMPTKQVSQWKLRTGHSPYRSVNISTLPALTSLDELIKK